MNPRVLEQLYLDHRERLYLCALAVTGRSDLAEDAVHDAIEGMCKTNTQPENLRAYAYRAVRNAALDQRKKHPGHTQLADHLDLFDLGNPTGEPDPIFSDKLRMTLGKLRQEEFEVVVLKTWAGLTFREIAELLDRPLNTTSSLYRRGMDRLRDLMGKMPWTNSNPNSVK